MNDKKSTAIQLEDEFKRLCMLISELEWARNRKLREKIKRMKTILNRLKLARPADSRKKFSA